MSARAPATTAKRASPSGRPLAVAAERCLVTTCVAITVPIVQESMFETFLGVIRDVLPDCAMCSWAVIPLREAAIALIEAHPGPPRSKALCNLKYKVCLYYQAAAVDQFDVWRDLQSRVTL